VRRLHVGGYYNHKQGTNAPTDVGGYNKKQKI
jgi:hypothetical protein